MQRIRYPLIEEDRPRSRQILVPGLLLGLLCLTRPDAALFPATLGAALVVARGFRRGTLRVVALLALLPILFTGAQLLFRLAYYHDIVPNTAYVKVAFSDTRWQTGTNYLRSGARYLVPLLVPTFLAVGLAPFVRALRRRTLLLVLPLPVWLLYVAVVGGDIFPARRHLMPALVLASLLLAEFARWLAEAGPTIREHGLALLAAMAVIFGAVQPMDRANKNAVEERWEWDGEVIGGLLRTGFEGRKPLIAVDAAGCLPFFSRLPAIDMMGLNDHHIARRRPANFGRGWLGHELGDGAYVLGRRPDVIIYGFPTGGYWGNFLSGKQMQKDRRYFELYRAVTIEGVVPRRVRSLVWFRRDSERIGIRRSNEGWIVPGYLLNKNTKTIAQPDRDGVLGALIAIGQPAVIDDLGLPPGRYRLALRSPDATLEAEVRQGPGEPSVLRDGATLDVLAGAPLRISVRATGPGSGHLRALVLQPAPGR